MEKWRIDQSPKEVHFKYKDEDVVITVRPMTWSKKNQILSKCMGYSSDGKATFDLDLYHKECLGYMVTKAPWGETNRIFLSSIDSDLGVKLQKLVPNAFEVGEDTDFLGSESENSLEEKD